MKPTIAQGFTLPAFRANRKMHSSQRGLSLIELMISITLGLIILAALSTLFINQTRTRVELDKANRMIDNGRYALDLLSKDLQLAGYLGEYIPPLSSCSSSPVGIRGYDTNLVNKPGALPAGITAADLSTGSDIVVVNRASTEVPVAVDAAVAGIQYMQVSLCQHDVLDYVISSDPADFTLRQKSCTPTSTTPYANVRRLLTNVYFISPSNTPGDGIPTLKRLETGNPNPVPLVEGIEYMQVEYGIDNNGTMQIMGETQMGSLLLNAVSPDPVAEKVKPGMGVYHDASPPLQKIPAGYTVETLTPQIGTVKGTITLAKDPGANAISPTAPGDPVPLTIPYLTATITPGSNVLTDLSAEPSFSLAREGLEICGLGIPNGSHIVTVSQPPAARTITLSLPALACNSADPGASCPPVTPCAPNDPTPSCKPVPLTIPEIVISPRPVAGDGVADFYTATPTSEQWGNVVSVKLTLLARNTEMTKNHTDTKVYDLGKDALGVTQTYGPRNDPYKRHVYTQFIRLVNISGRRE